MSNAKQIIAMLRSRADGDDEAFFSIALQVAASEARQGHRSTADEMRSEVERARSRRARGPSVAVAFSAPRGNLEGLLEFREPSLKLKDAVLDSSIAVPLSTVLHEQRRRDWLREHGRRPSRRLLFVGPPGSGKTMSAEAVAGELTLPLYVIRLEHLISRFMGDTAAKLRLVFDETSRRRGVYLFDEFDAVGAHRSATNDVAEMRRVLNSFLQFMEEDSSTDSVIICATNHPGMLDQALLRRYDAVIQFLPPTAGEIRDIVSRNIKPLKLSRIAWKQIEFAAQDLSQAEIVRAVDDVVKKAILEEKGEAKTTDIVQALTDRHRMREVFRAR